MARIYGSLTTEQEIALEGILDKVQNADPALNVRAMLDALTDIANAKAEHVRSNWQDEPLAREWERIARKLDRVTL